MLRVHANVLQSLREQFGIRSIKMLLMNNILIFFPQYAHFKPQKLKQQKLPARKGGKELGSDRHGANFHHRLLQNREISNGNFPLFPYCLRLHSSLSQYICHNSLESVYWLCIFRERLSYWISKVRSN